MINMFPRCGKVVLRIGTPFEMFVDGRFFLKLEAAATLESVGNYCECLQAAVVNIHSCAASVEVELRSFFESPGYVCRTVWCSKVDLSIRGFTLQPFVRCVEYFDNRSIASVGSS